MPEQQIQVTPIPAFNDNYMWLISKGNKAAVVDPGQHEPVLEFLENSGLQLDYILLTHHHADHIGGVDALLRHCEPVVYAPKDSRIPEPAKRVAEGDALSLPNLDLNFEVIEVAAHTRSHIAFYGHGMLFSGDTLFSIGCGRLFEGTAGQMQNALDKLAKLPPQTRVYCGHEYTQSNCEFALQVEPGNQVLEQKYQQVRQARSEGLVTLPGTIGEELAANPFMRTRQDSVVRAAQEIVPGTQPGAQTLAVIRSWKDRS